MDRNDKGAAHGADPARSLSARRAWIEMTVYDLDNAWIRMVALRKESVDRNHTVQVIIVVVDTSLSARRAWIEMIF